jgi:hypothetical protein
MRVAAGRNVPLGFDRVMEIENLGVDPKGRVDIVFGPNIKRAFRLLL